MIEPRETERWTRELAAMIRKAGSDDPETFATIVAMLDVAINQLPAAAERLRAPGQNGLAGYSWQNIADACSTSRQTVWNRFGPHAKNAPKIIATRERGTSS
jgi:hypothetical protein